MQGRCSATNTRCWAECRRSSTTGGSSWERGMGQCHVDTLREEGRMPPSALCHNDTLSRHHHPRYTRHRYRQVDRSQLLTYDRVHSPGWVSGLEEVGVPHSDRPLSGKNIGAAMHPSCIRKTDQCWKRSYVMNSYLEPVYLAAHFFCLGSSQHPRTVLQCPADVQRQARPITNAAIGCDT